MSRRPVVFVAIAAGFGCSSPPTAPPAAIAVGTDLTGSRGPAAQLAPSPIRRQVARLAAQGYRAFAIDSTRTLVCGPRGCACLAELDCAGSCITLADNLAAFRTALASPAAGVTCELADTGGLCDYSYFRFEGDGDRRQQRYFAPSGRLAGIRTTSDIPAYCDGLATVEFAGVVPDCGQAPREVTVLCATPGRVAPLVNPAEQLDRLLGR